MGHTVVVLEGDQTGQELLEEALRVVDQAIIGLDLNLSRFDLSLENRRETQNSVGLKQRALFAALVLE